jgi:hypothetical protein
MPDDCLRVTLRLKAIDDLFRDPDLSPFDPYYSPTTCVAGMDYLVAEMQRRPGDTPTELTVLLPPDQIAACPDLEARTRAAIARYSEAWASTTRQSRDVETYKTKRVAGVAVLIFLVANLLFIWYGRTGSILGVSNILLDVMMDGLSITSWVAIWWPLDQLLHARWQSQQDENAYHSLQGISLRILPDPTPPEAPWVGTTAQT